MLPRTRQWREVIALVGGAASAASVAGATLDAVEAQFTTAAQDRGLFRAFWLLAQLPDAARAEDFGRALQELGISTSGDLSAAGLVAGFTEAIDRDLRTTGGRTDLGELGQMAAVETLASTLADRTVSLFGATPTDVQRALAGLATEVQFGAFAREFFARFTERFLGYYVSRELPLHVGPDIPFQSRREEGAFADALDLHCRQASRVVEEFAGGWYSKAKFKRDLTPARAQRFLAYALKKIRIELSRDQTQ